MNSWSVLKCLLLAPCHFQDLFVVIFMDEILILFDSLEESLSCEDAKQRATG
jgi:hypothetical protein